MKSATKAKLTPGSTVKQSALRTAAGNRPEAPDNTRPQIVAAAAIEFAAKGLAGARVDAIAKASGCNKAMLYYFFKNKEGLYLEVLEDAYADMRQRSVSWTSAILPPSSPSAGSWNSSSTMSVATLC